MRQCFQSISPKTRLLNFYRDHGAKRQIDAALPAVRPEKMQSASDRPLI